MPRIVLLLALALVGCGGPSFSTDRGEDAGSPAAPATSSPIEVVSESTPIPLPHSQPDDAKAQRPREDDAGGAIATSPGEPEVDSGKAPITEPRPDGGQPVRPNAELCQEGTSQVIAAPLDTPRGGLDCGSVCGWTAEDAPRGFSSAECETVTSCGELETKLTGPVDWTLFLGTPDPACYRLIGGLSKNFTAGFNVGPNVCARFTSSDPDRVFQTAPISSLSPSSCLIVSGSSVKVLSHRDAAPAWVRVETAPVIPGVPCPFAC